MMAEARLYKQNLEKTFLEEKHQIEIQNLKLQQNILKLQEEKEKLIIEKIKLEMQNLK